MTDEHKGAVVYDGRYQALCRCGWSSLRVADMETACEHLRHHVERPNQTFWPFPRA